MDMTGRENPTEEIDTMMEENTNAAINPAKVASLVQTILLARNAGLGGPSQAAGQAPQQAPAAQLNQALSAAPPPGSNSANQPGPPGPNVPENAQMNGAPAAPGLPLEAQTMLQNGKTTGRVLSSEKLPPMQITPTTRTKTVHRDAQGRISKIVEE